MAWKIEFDRAAERELAKLDPQSAKRILSFLRERVQPLKNPRSIGEALRGSLGNFWKYRVGDFRIIAASEDDRMRILVVRAGNRKEVYR
jgi:mRNA interferase RelE/StbE